ncbi:hypothetical protein LINGRAHAP2_LOCUS36290 [Linum grandiflorum]
MNPLEKQVSERENLDCGTN